MKEFSVIENDNGIKLIKYLGKVLNNASTSFIYKMLRKKNITLNDAKADGNEVLVSGDVIKIYFSDDTFDKFSADNEETIINSVSGYYKKMPPIVYEDKSLLILNKPVGMLSQKAHPDDISLNEICLSYMQENGEITEESLKIYKPSVINRLDRNTCGLIIFAKTYSAANIFSKALKERTLHKFYRCVVIGCIDKEMTLCGKLEKDSEKNFVTISNTDSDDVNIYTKIKPIKSGRDFSLLEILLITGKTHQIRAHLASVGHPIAGDYKYGNRKINDELLGKHNIKSQLLISCRMVMPKLSGEFEYLSEREFSVDTPEIFERLI